MAELTCATCGQLLPRTGRVCGKCHQAMGVTDKWQIIGSTVLHRDCNNPTMKEDTPPGPQIHIEDFRA